MKRLFYYLIVYGLLLSCSGEKQEDMRNALDSLNTLNKLGLPYSVSEIQPLVDYFSNNGSSNDLMLAYYLLGRSYHEQHEAPVALKYYQKAIEHADTTSKECDYFTLSRCYSQIADIHYQQNLPNYKEIRENSIYYCLLAGDTLAALSDYEQMANEYERRGKTDSALFVIDSLINWYHQHGLEQDAAISGGRAFSILVSEKAFTSAKKYMQKYEAESGFFNQDGTIASGREIYYYYKALLLMNEHKLDSAEFWLRRELDATDYNNQNSASKGLALLYKMRNMPDSAMKYALYSYDMNDSVYAQMTSNEIEQIQAMYNYTRHQEEARRHAEIASQERIKKEISTMLLCIVCLVAFYFIRRLNIKRKEEKARYKEGVALLAQQQAEVILLRQHKQDFEQLLLDKELQIESLKKELSKNRKIKIKSNAEKSLQESSEYKQLIKMAVKGQIPTETDWHNIYMLVIEYFPEFNEFITSKRYQLNLKEYHTCILFRLHLRAQDVSHILSVSPAYISKISSEIMQKLFQEKGNSKQLIEKLNDIS